MKKLFRYGVDRPILTWLLLIVGIILIIFNHYYLWIPGLILLLVGIMLVLHTYRKYQIVDNLIYNCDLKTAQKILDVGTGRGYFMTHVAKAAGYIAFVTGIEDQRHDRITKARKNARKEKVQNRVNIIHGDVRHLPFPEASFNLVTSLGRKRRGRKAKTNAYQAVCDDILRVLKQDGRFIMVSDQADIDRFANYLHHQDGVKLSCTSSSKWNNFKWGTLTAIKTI